MIRVKMTTIKRKGLTVPGGWIARIPSVKLFVEEQQHYVRYYERRGMPEARAHDTVLNAITALWVRAWTDRLRESVANAAVRYNKMFPELKLAGFDPEQVQAVYVPGEKTGRDGKPAAYELLRRLGEAERARRRGDHAG